MKPNPIQHAFKLKNTLDQLSTLRHEIEAFGVVSGLPEKCIFELNLVLDELFTNVVSYGFNSPHVRWISYCCTYQEHVVTIRIEDKARPFNPLAVRGPDLACPIDQRKVGGVGIHLVKRFIDEIDYERSGDRNILTLKKNVDDHQVFDS